MIALVRSVIFRGHRGRIEIQRPRIDVGEDHACALYRDGIGRRDPTDRRRDHFVARPNSGRNHRQLQPRRG